MGKKKQLQKYYWFHIVLVVCYWSWDWYLGMVDIPSKTPLVGIFYCQWVSAVDNYLVRYGSQGLLLSLSAGTLGHMQGLCILPLSKEVPRFRAPWLPIHKSILHLNVLSFDEYEMSFSISFHYFEFEVCFVGHWDRNPSPMLDDRSLTLYRGGVPSYLNLMCCGLFKPMENLPLSEWRQRRSR